MALQIQDPSQAVITSVGAALNGGTANSTTPVIKGTADAGDTVNIYDGVRLIGTALVGVDGTWSFTPTTALKGGSHSFAAIAEDSSGNFGASSVPLTVQVGTTVVAPAAPGITALTDNVGTKTGPITNGTTTDDSHPVLTGTGTAGNTIAVYDGATLIGTTTVASDGTWSVKPATALADGAHDIYATQTNSAGTSPHSTDISFTVNTTTPATPAAPTLTDDNGAAIPAGSTTADAHPHINGKGTAGDTITVYDNGVVIGSTTVAGDGTWTFKPSTDLANGSNSITVIETNPAGTSSAASAAVAVIVDTTVPAAPVITTLIDDQGNTILNNTSMDAHPNVNGTGKAGDIVTLYDGTKVLGSAVVDATGKWSIKPATDLSVGAHDFSAIEKNAAGTADPASAHVAFTVNLTNPAPVITLVTDAVGPVTGNVPSGSTTDDPRPVISGTGTYGSVVHVYDGSSVDLGSVVVTAAGTWSFQPSSNLANGAHNLVAWAKTPAGAWSLASPTWTITVDTTTPAKMATPVLTDDSNASIPAGSTTTDGHPHISGTGTAGDTVKIYDGSTLIGSAVVDGTGKWSFTPSTDVSTGVHSITATQTNAAGTTGPASDAIAFTFTPVAGAPVITNVLDTVGTSPTLVSIPSGGATSGNQPTVSGTGTVGDTVYIFQNGAGCGSTTVDATGHWSLKIPGAMSEGAHIMTATQFASGQAQSAASNSWTITINTTTPATPAAPTLTDDNGAAIPAGSTTADAHPHISGKGTAGDIIKVYDNGVVIGSTTVATDATWTFKPSTDLANGSNSFTVIETNPAGTSSATSPATAVVVDTTTPAAPATPTLTDDSNASIPAGASSSDGHPHISGTGVSGDIIKIYDGATVIGSTKVDGTGKWTFTPATDLSIGAHSITATQTNAAGTTSAMSGAATYTFAQTVAPPVITVLGEWNVATGSEAAKLSTGGTTPYAANNIYGTGISGDTVKLYDGATLVGSAVVGTDGSWWWGTLTWATGAHTLTATQTSSAGVTSAVSNTFTFTVNTSTPATPAAPTLTDDSNASIPAGSTSTDGHPHISGTGTAGDKITVYDGSTVLGTATVDTNGKWTFTPATDLASGAHSINVTETNAAGTASAHSANTAFTLYVGPAETVSITSLTNSYTNLSIPVNTNSSNTSPVVHGSVSSALQTGETVAVYRDNVKIGTATVSGTSWTFNDSGVPLGAHTYTAQVVTTASKGATSNSWAFTEVVPTPSLILIASCTNGYVSTNGIILQFYCDSPFTYRSLTVSDGAGHTYTYSTSLGNSYGGDAAVNFTPNPSLTYTTTIVLNDGTSHVIDTVAGTRFYYAFGYEAVNGSVVSAVRDISLTSEAASNVTDAQADNNAVTNVAAADPVAAQPHTVVGEHDAFTGTTGNDTVDLNADPASYFKESTAHIQGSTVHPTEPAGTMPAANTLHLTGDHQILDLTSLTGKTAAAKISGIEVIDLGGHANNLKLSLTDVLNLGEQDLFQKDGHQQLMVKGSNGDTVDLSNAHIAGVADGQWQAEGTAVVGGVTYNVYEHSGAHTELLVQQGVQIALHN